MHNKFLLYSRYSVHNLQTAKSNDMQISGGLIVNVTLLLYKEKNGCIELSGFVESVTKRTERKKNRMKLFSNSLHLTCCFQRWSPALAV